MSIFFINIFFSGQGYADPDRRLHEDRWLSDVTIEDRGVSDVMWRPLGVRCNMWNFRKLGDLRPKYEYRTIIGPQYSEEIYNHETLQGMPLYIYYCWIKAIE